MTVTRRKTVPKAIETDVMVKCRRRCLLCYGLQRDTQVKQGQIAHLDHECDNNGVENLAFLCLPHHDQYDSKTSQSKNFTLSEMKHFQDELSMFIESEKSVPWPDYAAVVRGDSLSALSKSYDPSQPEIYDRRITIYRHLKTFLLLVLSEAEVTLQQLRDFATATDEALFLFNPEIDDYLNSVYRKGVRLYYTNGRLRQPEFDLNENFAAMLDENTEVLNWLAGQLNESRHLFRKYLFIG